LAAVLLAAACLCTPAGASASAGGELHEFHFTLGTDLTPDACASTTDIASGPGTVGRSCRLRCRPMSAGPHRDGKPVAVQNPEAMMSIQARAHWGRRPSLASDRVRSPDGVVVR
jgi:hypothetical protein